MRVYVFLFIINIFVLISLCTNSIVSLYSNDDSIYHEIPSTYVYKHGQSFVDDEEDIEYEHFEFNQEISMQDSFVNDEHRRASLESSRGNHEQAIKVIKKLIRKYPRSAELYNDCAVFFMRMNKYEQACVYVHQATILDPGHLKAWYNYGTSLLALDRYEESIPVLRKAKSIQPYHNSTLFNLAIALSRSGQPGVAKEVYKELCSINKSASSASAYQNLGVLYMRDGQLPEAVKSFRAALYKRPRYATARYNLAICLRKMGLNKEAKEEYAKLLMVEPDHYKSLINLAHLKSNEQDYAGALPLLKRATTSGKVTHLTYYKLAKCHEAMKQQDEALLALEESLAIKSNYVKAWHMHAQLSFDQSRYETARASVLNAIALKPGEHKYVYLLASIYVELKQPSQAVGLYKKATALDETHYLSWYNLGLNQYRCDEYKSAIAAFNKAVILAPQSHRAWYMLGLAQYNVGELHKALNSFTESNKRQEHYRSLYNMALCYESMDDTEAALSLYKQALAIEPLHKQSLARLAKLYMHLNQSEKALKICKKLLSLNRNDKTAYVIAKRLVDKKATKTARPFLNLLLEENHALESKAKSLLHSQAVRLDEQESAQEESTEQELTH